MRLWVVSFVSACLGLLLGWGVFGVPSKTVIVRPAPSTTVPVHCFVISGSYITPGVYCLTPQSKVTS